MSTNAATNNDEVVVELLASSGLGNDRRAGLASNAASRRPAFRVYETTGRINGRHNASRSVLT